LPLCVAVTRTFLFLLIEIKPESVAVISMPVWGFFAGFGLWVFLFTIMPHPVKTYVFGHEMTHALWGLLMGARVSDINITEEGGSVRLSKTNFLIALAPYYFPFYSALTLLIYAALYAFTDLHAYKPLWLGLLGLTWAFHITFTFRMMREHQSDLSSHGFLFSYAVIYLFNLLGICFWIVAVGSPDTRLFLCKLTNEMLDIIAFFTGTAERCAVFIKNFLQ
jgi:hypothetical protein